MYMKIGIFDSGIGGQAMAHRIQQAFPQATLLIVNDTAHLPYGDRSPHEITKLTNIAIQPLLAAQCSAIVIACNSATSAAIDTLRSTYPKQNFIGVEPMIRTAALLTKTGTIAVCATPATLATSRYRKLVDTYGTSVTILEPDCQSWANTIEQGLGYTANMYRTVESLHQRQADVIVLGCTHYHWIAQDMQSHLGNSTHILEPTNAIIRRLQSL